MQCSKKGRTGGSEPVMPGALAALRLSPPVDRTVKPAACCCASSPDAARWNYSAAFDPGVFAREAILRRTMSM